MQNLIFLNPILGIMSFIVGMIFFYLYFKTKDNAKKFKFIADLEAVFGSSRRYFFINLILIFLLIISFSLLIANPHLKETKTKEIRNGIDIAIVLDLSYSMTAEDIKPNRLEVAKEVISDFTSKLKTDRVGLVLFSGKPFTSVPLTFDYDFITNYVKNITIQSINQDYQHLQGTSIGDALLYGANLFETSEGDKREKVIVLLTDGEANRGIDPIEAVRYLKEKNIKVHTVGIGGDKDTFVTFQNIYGSQKIAIGGIDEENLKAIANFTKGMYYRADNKETFEKIFEKLNLLQKKEIQVDQFQILTPYYKIFVYIIFSLFTFHVIFNIYYYLRQYIKYKYSYISLLLAYLICLFSFLNFSINIIKNVQKTSSNIVFVLDVSKSMLALDYGENSRLEIAKVFMKNFIGENISNNYGLTIFAGDITSVLPITSDKSLFLTFLESIDEKTILKGGTTFKEVIEAAIARFDEKSNGGAIVILSDFEPNLDSNQKEILLKNIGTLKETLDKKNIKLYQIGIGKTTGNKIIVGYDLFGRTIYLKDNFGKEVITKFDKDFFDSFSQKLNGEKHIINEIEDIKNIILKNIPSSELEVNQNIKIDFSRYVMMISFVFFLIYLGLFYYFDRKGK